MKRDTQLAIISLFGACAVVGVLPFALYRLASGAYGVAALDLLIALGIASVVGYAWRTGRTRGAGHVMAVINNGGAVLSAVMLGNAGALWMYAVLMSNFFLVPRRQSIALSLAAVSALAVHGGAFDGPLHTAAFVMSALLVATLAGILAHWTQVQREQLETLATHDALTGLGNRRAMEQDLQKAMLARERLGTPVSLAIVDIDHFKQVNDRHGHAAGDAVLVAFADVLRGAVRRVDGVYRLGGEEFLFLLPGTDKAGLPTVIESIRVLIATRLHGPDGPLTASIGAATLFPGEPVQSWLARADRALYRAKDLGRNRACVEGARPVAVPDPGPAVHAASSRPPLPRDRA